jgi:eukaryotic-like serine/threonine-protein kinase
MAESRHRLGLELETGQIFEERYRIVRKIGQGGMGCVYLAEDLRLGLKLRALKLTRPLEDEQTTFLREARMLSELDHPNLPAIVDYYSPGPEGIACIVMEYIAGETLADHFHRRHRKLPFLEVLRIAIDLSEILVYLHSRSPAVVFRDLKPANVLFDDQGRAVLVDFGIARKVRPGQEKDTLQLGTPGFAAPEQLRGEQSKPRTDLYGLGALIFHLLSGGQFAMRQSGVPIGRVLQEDVPRRFSILLESLLAHDEVERPQSAFELREKLIEIRQGKEYDEAGWVPSGSEKKAHESAYVIAVLSAYPGAGATFCSLALSSSLRRAKRSHALVECPGTEAELYALLDGGRRMPRDSVFAEPEGGQASSPAWNNGEAVYYPANPDRMFGGVPDQAFAGWLWKLGVPLVLLDVSSRWDQPGFAEWLIGAVDRLVFVSDCYPAKWSSRRQVTCQELLQMAKERLVTVSWWVNRDQSFPARSQWLASLPMKPHVLIPNLDSMPLLASLWGGRGVSDDRCSAERIDAALNKLLRKL